jgi:predicted amidohydrolase YtcJ
LKEFLKMRIDRLFLSLTMIFTGLLGCHRPPAAHRPEVLIYTAREIVTLDENRPSVEAVAIEGDRIIATGGLDELKRSLATRSFRVDRSFDDSVLIPGLINQHEHAWLAAIAMLVEIISIEDWTLPERTIPRAKNPADYRRRLTSVIAQHSAKDEVLYTWGYHGLFHGDLSRSDLDEMSQEIPIVVLHRSMHELILNSAALERFAIDQAVLDGIPAAARAQTDLAGGHFWEQGLMPIVPRVFPDMLAPERYLPALARVRRYWHAAGTTLVAEPGGIVSPALTAMQNRVLGDSDTPFRMYYIPDGRTMLLSFDENDVIAETEKLFQSATGMTQFLPKQVKLFADGAMFSQLMQMKDGYLDGHDGEWLMEPAVFAKAFKIYWDAEYQIHIHQNGDAGLDLVLDTLEENLERHPRDDHRTVIVHFGFSRPNQVERIARLGAIVSANPFYPVVLANRYSEVGIGPERAQEMVRLGDVVRAGISVSLHADMPMAPGQPLLLMQSAITRMTVEGNIAGPTQRLSPEQALRAVTLDAAYSLRLEDQVGSIEPGKLANLTVLSENPLTVPPETIENIEIRGTLHEGRVFRAR